MESVQLVDESNDKKYFSIIPNYVLNHSTANDQALYCQMKRLAGENGICFASKGYLMKHLGIGKKALNRSLEYLTSHRWIKAIGSHRVETPGGLQPIPTYKINDIWKMNTNYYDNQGGSKSTPLDLLYHEGGVQKDQRGGLKVLQGGSRRATKKNYNKNINKIRELNKLRTDLINRKILK